ncbi:DNA topoisomerase 3 [Megamonas hypermegale]|uniref:DNA topoisomerase 3 n=1 Tax=Megamonas hypermegale TaxID=158847 RepID=UPI00195F1DFA|nr:DNA topoisomerase 3 [Megamonas hypermegale]MBM6760228.1 DNA topoisomerase 3 [Megamonas hypermegale]
MRLYIAEKPSMGAEIAKCLTGPIQRKDGYLITKDGVVTWAFGHILRQAEPDEYNAAYKKWNAADLPIIPTKWKMIIDESCKKQFGIIKNLIDKADEIVHAGDPDREGQLLIDEVLDYVHCQKPVKRILLNALDEESIKKANANLRDNKDFLNLKKSALARARADWLIGMNLSRAYTLAARRAGKKEVLAIGRVKTPTLALVVRRERELQNFKPVDYFIIKAIFAHQNGEFITTWKPQDTQKGLDSENRLLDENIAKDLIAKFASKTEQGKIIAYQKAQKKEAQRLPFSLSTLQVLAGKRFGYEPQLVLDTAQKLYEKKLTTYPRSDCEYLPQSQFNDAKVIVHNLLNYQDKQLSSWAKKADISIKSRAWNDKKITAHHAIIPTKIKANLNALSEVERNVYFLIAQAYIAQFYSVHIYDQTKITVMYMNENFTASGRTVKQLGWKELYLQNANKNKLNYEEINEKEEENSSLPLMKKNDVVDYIDGKYEKKSTKPPTRFTSATLLAGMKEIHKYVKDVEVKKKLKDIYGIGTEATRASIIEDLIKRGFLQTEGKKKYLIPTQTAYMLIDVLPDEMTYPDSTAIWEDYLHSLSEGEGTVEEFLQMQANFTKDLCLKANATVLVGQNEYKCPRCKRGILVKRNGKNGTFWGCSNFPTCRMTCNDVDGKPDLRTKTYVSSKYSNVNYSNFYDTLNEVEKTTDSGIISAWDLVLQNKMNPSFNKVKKSAMPLEKQAKQGTKNVDSKYLCPHCKDGSLRRIHGKNGWFWACSNYPHCTATYDDNNGMPVI